MSTGQRFILAAVLLVILSPDRGGVEAAETESQAVLTVRVVNGTAGGAPVEGDVVTVQIYQHRQLLRTLRGEASADGNAVFEKVQTGEHMAAAPSATHQEMRFHGSAVTLDPQRDAVSARVEVYDVSHRTSSLSVDTHHIIIRARGDSLDVTEYMWIRNSSDMAVTSEQKDSQGRPVVLNFVLPKGFAKPTFSSYFEEPAVVFTEEGFFDTMSVPPGNHRAVFSYVLDIRADTVDFLRTNSVPTREVVVFAELGQGEVEGLGPAADQVIRLDSAPMTYYERGNLSAGEEIAFRITGFNVGEPEAYSWAVIAIVVGAILVLVFLRLRSRNGSTEDSVTH